MDPIPQDAGRGAGDFRRARFEARVGRWLRWARARLPGLEPCCGGCCRFLACFEEERHALGEGHTTERRFETVEVGKIVGSLGRCSSFDGRFLPLCSCSGERWERISEALRQGRPLPPVELYRIGDRYFVSDGNHRVSVVRYHGAVMVDALVTEISPGCDC